MVTDDQDPAIPAFLRLPPAERPRRMRCLTPMISLTALAAARDRYQAQFGTQPDESRLDHRGIWHRIELINLACERGISLDALPEALAADRKVDDPTR
ncbi:hypothetical protein [Aromatoleum petrolei]|uniref:Uncharacterized protein n=1 Tax=Aromatoleum petrolei TaxID=76116 RepID=A0ABX1MIT1_9RHOO|nr:hypothetical protein [Aromatoleum petrolei]NMF87663.1 hypothetical protein [Aromatoleum petrolei]QTQ38148.1 Uncharacterized protein ToN1_40440 [Aromatoleum petrolei]